MKIFLSSKADKQLHHLPLKMHDLMIKEIKKLDRCPFPSGVKKLRNRDGWRIRVGDYRILYTIDFKRKEIVILSVSHRKEAYRF